jgi:hypothetical protein
MSRPTGAKEVLPVPTEIPVHAAEHIQAPNYPGVVLSISRPEVSKGGEISPRIEESQVFFREGGMVFEEVDRISSPGNLSFEILYSLHLSGHLPIISNSTPAGNRFLPFFRPTKRG